MDQQWDRRGFLRAGAAAGLLAIAGCSSDKAAPAASGGGGNGPVTITHIFGETTISQPPKQDGHMRWMQMSIANLAIHYAFDFTM